MNQVGLEQGRRLLVRVAASGAIAAGIGLFVTPFATSMFSRTSAANHLTDTVRPAMNNAAFASATADLATVITAYGQLGNNLLPAMAARAHQPTATFVSQLRSTYPQIRAGMDNFDTAVANARRILAVLTANRANYAAADSLPMKGVPLTVAPWVYLGAGVLLVGTGLAIMGRPQAGLAALLVIALGIAIVPLATSEPNKLSDTKTLVHNLRTTLSPKAAATAREQFTTFNTMLATFNTNALPAFASAAKMTQTQVIALVGAEAPLLAPSGKDVPRILNKFGGLTLALVNQVGNYHRTSQLPFRLLGRLFVIPGFFLAALAGLTLVASGSSRRRSGQVVGPDEAGLRDNTQNSLPSGSASVIQPLPSGRR